MIVRRVLSAPLPYAADMVLRCLNVRQPATAVVYGALHETRALRRAARRRDDGSFLAPRALYWTRLPTCAEQKSLSDQSHAVVSLARYCRHKDAFDWMAELDTRLNVWQRVYHELEGDDAVSSSSASLTVSERFKWWTWVLADEQHSTRRHAPTLAMRLRRYVEACCRRRQKTPSPTPPSVASTNDRGGGGRRRGSNVVVLSGAVHRAIVAVQAHWRRRRARCRCLATRFYVQYVARLARTVERWRCILHTQVLALFHELHATGLAAFDGKLENLMFAMSPHDDDREEMGAGTFIYTPSGSATEDDANNTATEDDTNNTATEDDDANNTTATETGRSVTLAFVDVNGLRPFDTSTGKYEHITMSEFHTFCTTTVRSSHHTVASLARQFLERPAPSTVGASLRAHAWDGGTFYAPEELMAWFGGHPVARRLLCAVYGESLAAARVDARRSDVYRIGMIFLQTYMVPLPRLSATEGQPFRKAGLNILSQVIAPPAQLATCIQKYVPDATKRKWIARMVEVDPVRRPTIQDVRAVI